MLILQVAVKALYDQLVATAYDGHKSILRLPISSKLE